MKYKINTFFQIFATIHENSFKKNISSCMVSSSALHGFETELFNQDNTQRFQLSRIIRRSRSVYLFLHSFRMVLHIFYVLQKELIRFCSPVVFASLVVWNLNRVWLVLCHLFCRGFILSKIAQFSANITTLLGRQLLRQLQSTFKWRND